MKIETKDTFDYYIFKLVKSLKIKRGKFMNLGIRYNIYLHCVKIQEQTFPLLWRILQFECFVVEVSNNYNAACCLPKSVENHFKKLVFVNSE